MTVIFCTALLKSYGTTMSWMFKYLYRTWFGLLVFWSASTAIVGLWRSRERKTLIPVIVRDPSDAPEERPAA